MSVLDLIRDSSVRHEYTVTVDLDPEKTPEHPTMGPNDYVFKPDLLLIHWVQENGGKWVRKDVSIKGYLFIGGKLANSSVHRRAMYKWWENDTLVWWVSEIVQEYKPKEVS